MGIGESKIIIKGGRIVDGTGEPAYPGDLVISGDKIQAVTQPEAIFKGGEYEVFDAADCIVCPGFIDAHAHDDVSLLEFPDQGNKIRMGVTTVINGNCGVSVAPLSQENLKNIRETVVGVLVKSDKHCFPTLRDYLASLEGKPPKTNHAIFIGHNTLRVTALKGYLAEPSPEEMRKMRNMVRGAMEMGALGLSTGLAYAPGLAASTLEVVELARVVSEYGGIYSTHLRNEGDKLEDAVFEAVDIASQANVPLQLSHHKAIGSKNYGKVLRTLSQVEEASQLEGRIHLDVYPYTAVSTDLEALITHQGLDERKVGSCLIAFSEPFMDVSGKSIEEISRSWRVSRMEAVRRLLPAIGIYFCLSEDDICTLLRHPLVMVGSDGIPSKGLPHPRLYGTFARILREFVVKKKILKLETAVWKMTGLPADAFRLHNRGKISQGYYADLAIFKLEDVKDNATYDDPKKEATGFRYVFVNGECVLRDGRLTHKCPGRFLRRDAS